MRERIRGKKTEQKSDLLLRQRLPPTCGSTKNLCAVRQFNIRAFTGRSPGGRRSVRRRDLHTKSDKKATVPCRFPPPRCSAFSVHRAGGRQGASGSVAIQLWERLVASRHSPSPLCAASMAKRLFTVAFYVVLFNFFSSSALFQFFLQLRFTCSAPQNRFSSKIAIKSLWKFMSIVAAICEERKRRKNK